MRSTSGKITISKTSAAGRKLSSLMKSRSSRSSKARAYSSFQSAAASGPFKGLKKAPKISVPKSKRISSGPSIKGRKLTAKSSYGSQRAQIYKGSANSAAMSYFGNFQKGRKIA